MLTRGNQVQARQTRVWSPDILMLCEWRGGLASGHIPWLIPSKGEDGHSRGDRPLWCWPCYLSALCGPGLIRSHKWSLERWLSWERAWLASTRTRVQSLKLIKRKGLCGVICMPVTPMLGSSKQIPRARVLSPASLSLLGKF